LVAELALLGRTATGRVALDTAEVASAVEGTLDALVGAVRLVVADLTAVEALAGQTAALGLVGTLTSEVADLVAAVVLSVYGNSQRRTALTCDRPDRHLRLHRQHQHRRRRCPSCQHRQYRQYPQLSSRRLCMSVRLMASKCSGVHTSSGIPRHRCCTCSSMLAYKRLYLKGEHTRSRLTR
jgi:hypothetical protein